MHNIDIKINQSHIERKRCHIERSRYVAVVLDCARTDI
jgi:hypothetical protein